MPRLKKFLGEGKKEQKKAFARKMRNNPTKGEEAMWKLLRCKRMGGFKFRRQAPVLGWIVDFHCLGLKLIVEVDGGYHKDEEQYRKDRVRDQAMEDCGATVLRFTNDQVISHPATVRKAILDTVQHLAATRSRSGRQRSAQVKTIYPALERLS